MGDAPSHYAKALQALGLLHLPLHGAAFLLCTFLIGETPPSRVEDPLLLPGNGGEHDVHRKSGAIELLVHPLEAEAAPLEGRGDQGIGFSQGAAAIELANLQ